ncbi:unnamed protein product, partial [Brenthis ino]
MHTLLIVLAASCAVSAASNSQEFRDFYCGRRLATALAVVCESNMIKRSEIYNSLDTIEMRWPWLAPLRARRLGRSKRQIVSECCEKRCSHEEMSAYC